MTPEQRDFLNLRVKPSISGMREASFLTGLHIDGCIFLEKEGHLKSLANPPKGAQRYFSTQYLLKLSEDEKWLTRAIRLIRDHFKNRNSTCTKAPTMEEGSHE